MRAPIHANKHYVQFTRATVATVSIGTVNLVEGVNVTAANAVNEVQEGAIVKAIYVEVWLENSANTGSFVVTVYKQDAGAALMTYAQSVALGTFNGKKNILFTSQGLPPNDGVSGPVPIIRQWIKIPKGKARMALGDKMRLTVSNAGGDDLDYCGFATYKEYT